MTSPTERKSTATLRAENARARILAITNTGVFHGRAILREMLRAGYTEKEARAAMIGLIEDGVIERRPLQ